MITHEHGCGHVYSNDILGNPKITYILFFKESDLVVNLAGKN